VAGAKSGGTATPETGGKGDLSRYRQMRDFSKTPEPGGAVHAHAGPGLRFVIQKHAARALHYDLRLELDGVFKSWAVARGPSLDPQVKRLAIHVEDHPIDYGDFEGIIPQGEYGGGTVMIWDRGFWRPEGDPEKGYAKGHLAFELDGEKLKGRWHLVRTKGKPGEKKEQWLLFKADDGYAHPSSEGDVLEEAPDSVATHRSMERIADEQAAVWSSRGGLVKGDLSPADDPAETERGKGRTLGGKAGRSGSKAIQAIAATRTDILRPPHSVSLPKGREDARNSSLLGKRVAVSSPSPLGKQPASFSPSPLGERVGVRGDSQAPAKSLDIAPSSIAGAKKAGFPGFVDPCLALLMEKPPEGDAWLHEIKFDGYRLIGLIDGGRVRLMTRSGLDWTERFPGIAGALGALRAKSAIVDGEAVVEEENGVSSFSALQDALSDRRPASNAIFFAFDLLFLNGYGLRDSTQDGRKEALSHLLSSTSHPSLRYSEHIIGNGQGMIDHACRLGLEGVVSKRRNAPYRSGRHGEWVKSKCTNREEFVVGGYVPSTAARNAVGSLALGYFDNGKLIHVGRTGTGFTQKSAQSLHKQLQTLRVDRTSFANALTSEERRGLVPVEPKLVAEVEFRGWTQDRHLRHAAFKGLREDKPASEVQLEMPRQETSAPASKSKKSGAAKKEPPAVLKLSKSGAVEFAGVKFTHPDRVLWEGVGLTKLGLAEYYAGIADYILPHIVSRPLALVRCPNGAGGECFFQKHSFAGLTDAVEIARVADKDGEAEAIVVHDLRGLINLVQANVLEIHPWGARIEETDRPDILIFDLDPAEGVEWAAVIEGARDIRRRLQDVGIESYVKTSGGKGLHVVSPLEPTVGWDELKEFAHGIARAMEADEPPKYISTMAKKARGGKIFVDYLRNARGATAVAPYSTRARAGAPISTPVRWEELGPALTPARFNVSNIGRRIASLKSDPWEGFLTSPQPIAKAISAFQSNAKPVSRGR
jgi:bifunctional non-homologous end joining protein LigD